MYTYPMKIQMKVFRQKRIRIALVCILVCVVLYVGVFRTVTINPLTERDAMESLAGAQEHYILSPFESDGCSGNISQLWSTAVGRLSDVFPQIDESYADAKSIPFEYACQEHDLLYHKGVGGYAGRLVADNRLRDAILAYALVNVEDIKTRLGYESDEAAIFLYESIAEVIYRGVRLGGAPCTGESYAWGYGYNGGSCEVVR